MAAGSTSIAVGRSPAFSATKSAGRSTAPAGQQDHFAADAFACLTSSARRSGFPLLAAKGAGRPPRSGRSSSVRRPSLRHPDVLYEQAPAPRHNTASHPRSRGLLWRGESLPPRARPVAADWPLLRGQIQLTASHIRVRAALNCKSLTIDCRCRRRSVRVVAEATRPPSSLTTHSWATGGKNARRGESPLKPLSSRRSAAGLSVGSRCNT